MGRESLWNMVKDLEKQYKVKPKTYGEAAKLRIDDQSGRFQMGYMKSLKLQDIVQLN